MTERTVSCPCGQARLRISGDPLVQFYCHCNDCRRVHGAAYTPEAMFKAREVAVEGETIALTLKSTPRVSCAKCGTRLFADLPALKLRGVSGTLLPDFKAELHINCESALAPVRDDLPHYANSPESFGGDGKLAEW